MSTFQTRRFFIVSLEYRAKADPDDIGVIRIGPHSFGPGGLFTNSAEIYGVLRGITGLGQDMGEVLPESRYGAIIVDSTRGSLAFNSRIYDLFQKHSFIEQQVTVKSYLLHSDQIPGADTGELEFVGKIKSVATDVKGKLTTFSVSCDYIPQNAPSYRVNVTDWGTDIPDRSKGRDLPIVFGASQQCICYPVGERTPNRSFYVYASSYFNPAMNDGLRTGDIISTFMDSGEGYKNIAFAPAANTNVFGLSLEARSGSAANEELAIDVEKTSGITDNYLITAAKVDYIKQPNVSKTCGPSVTVEIRRKRSDALVPTEEIVASADNNFGSQTFPAGETIYLLFFKDAVLLWRPDGYFFNSRIADAIISGASWVRPKSTITDKTFVRRIDTSDAPGTAKHWIRDAAVSDAVFWELYAVARVTDFSQLGGLSGLVYPYRYFYLNQTTFTDTITEPTAPVIQTPINPQVGPAIDDLPLIVETEGLLDDNLGTITGFPNVLIERADHAIKALWYLANGFDASGIDITEYDVSTLIGNVAGKSNGAQSYREIMAEILENTASKLVPRRSGVPALWTYGVEQDLAGTINESDCILESIDIAGEEAIVNRVRAQYDRREIPLELADVQDQQRNYAGSFEDQDDDSVAFYGVKDLQSDFSTLNWLIEPNAVERWAEYKFARYGRERMIVKLTVPFWKADYREFELMDIIRVSHIDNPSDKGSASSNQEPPVTTEGLNEDDDFSQGFLWRRARNYKMRILSREPIYTLDGEAEISFRLLVLDSLTEGI